MTEEGAEGGRDGTTAAHSNVVFMRRGGDGRGYAVPYRLEQLRWHLERVLVGVLRDALGAAQEALARRCEDNHTESDASSRVAVATEDGVAAYCEGERRVRLHRHDMEEVLRAGLEFRFKALLEPGTPQPPPQALSDPAEVQLVERVCGSAPEAADRVAAALNRALPKRPLSTWQSPLTPECLVDLFLRAVALARLEPTARAVVLPLLGEHMAARLPRLYAIVEQLLTVSAAATPHELPAGSAPSGRAAGAASDPVARAAQSHQRVEQGRARVQREIERCLQGVELPEVVVRLLREPWARLLLWAYISDGPESELWVHHCAVMERLVWSFRVAAEGGRARQRLALEIPVLLHELTDGLHGVLHDPFELADLLRTLEEEYVRCLTANDPLLVSVSAAANDSIEAKQSSSTTGRAVTSQTLERLPEGTWLELSSASGEPLRLRLAGRSEEGGLVFSNRAGFKVLERSPQQLAAAVASGEAKLLNDAQLFSDGLSQVMRSLVERRIGHGDELASDD